MQRLHSRHNLLRRPQSKLLEIPADVIMKRSLTNLHGSKRCDRTVVYGFFRLGCDRLASLSLINIVKRNSYF